MQCNVLNVIVSFVIKIPAHPNIEIRNAKKKKWKPTLKAVTKISLLFFICDFLLLQWEVFIFDPLFLVACYVGGNHKNEKNIKSTTPGVPRRSPIQVLSWPDDA